MQPGGVDAVTAQQALGKVLLGTPAQEIQLFEPYQLPVWLDTIGTHIRAPEFLQNSPEVQQQVMALYQMVKMAAAQQAMQQAGEAATIQAGQMNEAAKANPMVAMQIHSAAAQSAPQAPDAEAGHPGPATPTDVGGPKKDAPPPPLAA
jgi:hypothetical protein